MGALLNTPSSGQSEVIDTLRYQGAIASGVPLNDLGPRVSHRWHGPEDRQNSDATFEADILTVIQALATAGYVVGHNPNTGATVDLTSGSPPPATRVVLTGAGRSYSRHPRPRPRRINN